MCQSPALALVSALARVWSSCVALIAFAWTIWCQIFIIHWHPSKLYPRCGLSSDAFMIIKEAHYKIFFLLLHIITYYGMIWFTTRSAVQCWATRSMFFLKKGFNRLKKNTRTGNQSRCFLIVTTTWPRNFKKWHEIDEEKPDFCLCPPIDPCFVINFS